MIIIIAKLVFWYMKQTSSKISWSTDPAIGNSIAVTAMFAIHMDINMVRNMKAIKSHCHETNNLSFMCFGGNPCLVTTFGSMPTSKRVL